MRVSFASFYSKYTHSALTHGVLSAIIPVATVCTLMLSIEAHAAQTQRHGSFTSMHALRYNIDNRHIRTHHTHEIKARSFRSRHHASIPASIYESSKEQQEQHVIVQPHDSAAPSPKHDDSAVVTIASLYEGSDYPATNLLAQQRDDTLDLNVVIAPYHTEIAAPAAIPETEHASIPEFLHQQEATHTDEEPSASVQPKITEEITDIKIASLEPLSHGTIEEVPPTVLLSGSTTVTPEREVRYFAGSEAPSSESASVSASTISPSEAPVEPTPSQTALVPTAPEPISLESQRILNQLPRELFPMRPEQGGKISMDRSDPSQALPKSDTNSSDAIGATMEIRRQAFDVNYELEKAYHALLQGQTEVSIRIYHDVLGAEPNNQHALFGLATTYHKINRLGEAREYYGRLLTLNPYHREALNNFLGLVAQESPESAIMYLEQLKAHNPDFSPISAQLAHIYSEQNQLTQAIQHMHDAVSLSPDNLIYQYNLAVMYDMHGEGQRASVIYQRLVRAGLEGQEIPASLQQLQERLTFLSSNG